MKCLNATVKHGGDNIMVWGCMAASGVGKLAFIDQRMDQYLYKSILQDNLSSSAEIVGLKENFIFQHDNDPKHTAHLVVEYLKVSGFKMLEWVAQSPDLNPIEHLWAHVEKKLKDRRISKKADLKTLISSFWSEIGSDITRNLVNSMRRRCLAVIQSNGGPTRY